MVESVDCEADETHQQNRTRRAVLLAAIAVGVSAVVLAAHWPALSCRALSFDDEQYLLENQLVQYPSWESTGRFLTEVLHPSTVRGYYQPLAMISLMIDYALGELSVLNGTPASADCTALTEVKCWFLPSDVLSELLHHYPRLSIGLIRMLSQRLMSATLKVQG